MTASAKSPQDEGAVAAVSDVLSLLAGELEHVRVLGARVEVAICEIAVRSSIDGRIVSELQHLDAILQHIAALRDFVSELSARCDVAHGVATDTALARITLAEVRARLSGGDLDEDMDGRWELV